MTNERLRERFYPNRQPNLVQGEPRLLALNLTPSARQFDLNDCQLAEELQIGDSEPAGQLVERLPGRGRREAQLLLVLV